MEEIRERKEALKLVSMPLSVLLEKAESLRKSCSGNSVEMCAIINIRSGGCDMDCDFCAQRSGNGGLEYGLPDAGTFQEKVRELAEWPVAHIGLVSSGGALGREDLEKLCASIKALPQDLKSRICVSTGRLDRSGMRALREAGVQRYHHNLETSQRHYPGICRTQTWKSRLETARRALDSGFSLCSGAIFGIGETWEDRIDLAFSLKELGCENLPLNFLDPRPGTPLANKNYLTEDEALRIIAIYRLILPYAVLRICGGRCHAFGDRQDHVFEAGANALMTGDFLTTRGRCLDADLDMLSRLGLQVARSGLMAHQSAFAD